MLVAIPIKASAGVKAGSRRGTRAIWQRYQDLRIYLISVNELNKSQPIHKDKKIRGYTRKRFTGLIFKKAGRYLADLPYKFRPLKA